MKRLTMLGLLAAGLLRGLEGTAAAQERVSVSARREWRSARGSSTRRPSTTPIVPYDELAIAVPLVLEAGGVGALASLLWHC